MPIPAVPSARWRVGVAFPTAAIALAVCQCALAQTVSGAALSKRLRTQPVTLFGADVSGDLALPAQLRQPFTCLKCRFGGDITAVGARLTQPLDLAGSTIGGKFDLADSALSHGLDAAGARFGGIVDLRGARIHGEANFSAATFAGPALFGEALRAPKPRAKTNTRPQSQTRKRLDSFYGKADFSLSSFAQLASFENVIFGADADFTLANFHGDAVFASADFAGADPSAHQPRKRVGSGHALFVRTTFTGTTDFSSAYFRHTAHFDAAQFLAAADLTQTTFSAEAFFVAAHFMQVADFSQAEFDLPASFYRARFDAGSSFFAAHFVDQAQPKAMNTFERTHSAGTLDFTLADVERPTNLSQSTASAVSFSGATLPPAGIVIDRVAWQSLQMSVSNVIASINDTSTHDREDALALLESSAKAQNDLGLANAAHYQREVLLTSQYSWPVRAADIVFYRWAAGYFVRPLNPIAALLLLAATATLIRIAWESTATRRERGLRGITTRVGPSALRLFQRIRRFPDRYAQSLALIIPRRSNPSGTSTNRIELLIYRALVACALIGFANSNPTLREMFNALL